MLGQSVIAETREMLLDLNGEQLGYMIALYRKQAIKDEQTSRALSQLLKADNAFVADKAYGYLNEIEGLPNDIVGQLKKYSRHRN